MFFDRNSDVMTKISRILWISGFSPLDFAGGLWPCAKCNEVPQHGVSPGCTLKVDENGRFHFAFSAECAAARVVEASICAAKVHGLGAAFLFYDAALQQMAAYGGTSCFDTSDWSKAFNVSSKELLRLQANVLVEMDEKSGGELRERIEGGTLECPLATPSGIEMPERSASEEGKGNEDETGKVKFVFKQHTVVTCGNHVVKQIFFIIYIYISKYDM